MSEDATWLCIECGGTAKKDQPFGFDRFKNFPQAPDCPHCNKPKSMRVEKVLTEDIMGPIKLSQNVRLISVHKDIIQPLRLMRALMLQHHKGSKEQRNAIYYAIRVLERIYKGNKKEYYKIQLRPMRGGMEDGDRSEQS